MATVFWDRMGVLMAKLMQQGTKIKSEVYCETLKKLRRAIQNKNNGMLTVQCFSMTMHIHIQVLILLLHRAFQLGAV
jgi:hypothetical protein